MRLHTIKKFTACALSAVMLSMGTFAIGTVDTKAVEAVNQEDLDNANAAAAAAAENANKAQELVNKLASDEVNLNSIIKDLDDKITSVSANIQNLQNQIESKKIEIEDAQVQLAEAEATVAEQYEAMKVRIKYMYENNAKTYITVIFASQDMADMLNKAAYFQSITSYDREMLEKYAATTKVITDTKIQLENDKQEIESYQASAESEQKSLQIMSDAKQEQLGSVVAQKETTMLTVEQYLAEQAHQESLFDSLKSQQSAYDEMLKQMAAEEEQRRQEAENQAKLDQEQSSSAAGTESGGSTTDEQKPTTGGDTSGGGSSGGTVSSQGMIWPTPSRRITTYFGETNGLPYSYPHRGTDIGARSPGVAGDPIYAAATGIVEFSGWDSGGGGYMVYIYHGDGLQTIYEHMMQNPSVSVGEMVTQGQVIGYMGTTGNSTGVHLHFGVRINDVFQDPLNYVSP